MQPHQGLNVCIVHSIDELLATVAGYPVLV